MYCMTWKRKWHSYLSNRRSFYVVNCNNNLSFIESRKFNMIVRCKSYVENCISKNNYDSANTNTTDFNNKLNELNSKEEINFKI